MIPALSALANGAIASAVLTGTVWLILSLALRRRLNASTRYALWAATLAATLLMPIFYVGAPRARPLVRPVPARPAVSMDAFPEAVRVVESRPAESSTASRRRSVVSLSGTASRVPRWLATTWAVVSFFLLVRLFVSWVLLDRRRARAVPAPSNEARDWLAVCRAQRPGVVLATSDEIAIPIAVGPRHPSILIPAGLLRELAPEDLGRIVMHEAAHLARWDDYGLLAQRLVEALFPWHPVVRWITRQMDLEREVACDDFVVEATGQARQYASCLTRMVELCSGGGVSLAGAAAANSRSQLARRVDRLLEKGRHTGTRLLKTRLFAMVAVLGAVAWMVGKSPAMVAFAMPPSSTPPTVVAQTLPVPAIQMSSAMPTAMERAIEVARAEASPTPRPAQNEVVSPQPASPQSAAVIQPSQVFIPVDVTEPGGRFVTGLSAMNFKLFEDGVEQQLAQVVDDGSPASMGIVVDVSGSMGDKLEGERQAVAELLKNARPGDEFFLLQFNHDAVLSVPFTSDTIAIQNSMASVQVLGGTALRDAVHMAVDEMTHAHNSRKALVILSKGTDNSSGRSQSDLRQDLASVAASVYSINFAANPSTPAEATALGQGTAVAADNLEDARKAAAKIAVGLRNHYVLAYTSTNAGRDGAFRQVKIDLLAPRGLPPLKLRYRTGYFGTK